MASAEVPPLISGFLSKHKGRGKRDKKRWFVLTSTFLSYYEDPTSSNFIGRMRIEDISGLGRGAQRKGISFVSLIVEYSGGKKKSCQQFELTADSEKEEEEWFAALACIVPTGESVNTTKRSPSLSSSPFKRKSLVMLPGSAPKEDSLLNS